MATGYWSLVEPVWQSLNRSWDGGPIDFVRLFRSIPPEIGHLYAAHWCVSEFCNGGLHQFFSNTTGLLAPEAVEGFRAIGIRELAEVLAEAVAFFGNTYPREREHRQEVLKVRQGRRSKQWDPFTSLDERFFEHKDRFEDVANAYAEQAIAKARG